MRWVDADGQTLHDWHPEADYLRRMSPGRQSHAAAQMNHYMLRSEESFGLKKGTPSAVAGKDRYTDAFFARYNRNEAEDTSALANAAVFDRLHSQAMALPGLARLHHLCCADYVARLCDKAGTPPEQDARFGHHMAMADAG
jgi:hypothetical protein